MDRFTTKNDAQDQPVFEYCKVSGDEIFLGQSYLEDTEGNVLKDHDLEIVLEHCNIVRKWAGEEIV